MSHLWGRDGQSKLHLSHPRRLELPVRIAVPRITEPQPHLEDGTAYRQVSPTTLYIIKNLHGAVRLVL